MKDNRKCEKASGFTLIEVLVVLGVFVVISTVIVSILFVSLRGSKKSDVLVTTRENGYSALSKMARVIRYAKSIDLPASCVPSSGSVNSITITGSDDNQIVFACPASSSGGISSNSASLVDTSSVSVSSCSFTCSQPTSADPPTVMISFTLAAQGGNSAESIASVPFETSVTLRNFNH